MSSARGHECLTSPHQSIPPASGSFYSLSLPPFDPPLTSLASVLPGDILDLTPSQLSSSLWALAVMGQVDTSPFSRAWREVQAKGLAVYNKEGDVALTQIWQAREQLASTPSPLSPLHSLLAFPVTLPTHRLLWPSNSSLGGRNPPLPRHCHPPTPQESRPRRPPSPPPLPSRRPQKGSKSRSLGRTRVPGRPSSHTGGALDRLTRCSTWPRNATLELRSCCRRCVSPLHCLGETGRMTSAVPSNANPSLPPWG